MLYFIYIMLTNYMEIHSNSDAMSVQSKTEINTIYESHFCKLLSVINSRL